MQQASQGRAPICTNAATVGAAFETSRYKT